MSVTIYRQGGPAHNYRTYPQVAATIVQIGRRDLFTHYIDAKSIVADHFTIKLGRGQRAVRAHDPNAHVLLAELAYVVLTYDDSVMNAAAPTQP